MNRIIDFVRKFPRIFRIAKFSRYLVFGKIQRIKSFYKNLYFHTCQTRKFHKTKPKTRYAVMWASSNNLGDDIQTLAAINFLNKKGITEYSYIDRERLTDYDGEPVTLIMNGWFMNNMHKFPPLDMVTPVFIGFHCHYEELIKNNIPYFKKHAPIGCRDLHTVRLFEKYGIDACFTGCLTLFFDEHSSKGNGKYKVDIKYGEKRIADVNLDDYAGHIEIEHYIKDKSIINNVGARLKKAEKLLDLYRQAKSVITCRLHCVLPCRAFKTDVVFMHRNYDTDIRFQGLNGYIKGNTQGIEDLYATANSIFESVSKK